MLLVLLQPSLRRMANANVYQTLFQIILTKSSFSWPEFFDYVYGKQKTFFKKYWLNSFILSYLLPKIDIQILQDFYMMLNTSSSSQNLVLGGNSGEAIAKRLFDQVKNNETLSFESKLKRVPKFVDAQLNNLISLFDQFL